MTIDDTEEETQGRGTKDTGPQVIARYLKHLGTGAGVYRMLDLAGEVIYVGKARNLKARVSNYTRLGGHTSRIARMIASTASMEFVTTATESEALLLEANLIKRFRPTFNVLMRDDKSFPYILISREHAAPQIMKHRGSRNVKGAYFGPFASAGSVNRTLNMLQRAFLLRSCSDAMYESRTRPCLLYQIKRCSAPCTGEIPLEDYGKLVDEAERFLEGKTDAVQKKLNALMAAASAELEFERAARYRDRLAALAHVQAVQGINPHGVEEADVFALFQQGGQSCVQVFFFRGGQNWGNRAYFPRADRSVELDEVLESFIAQFYDDKPVPRCIFLSHNLAERELLAEALSIKAGRKVEIAVPQRGEKAGLVAHALTNAKEALGRKMADASTQAKLLEGVAAAFGLAGRPARIEVYDNSHIQGTNAVGAMIVAGPEGFVKNQYRKFNIKSETLTPGDDYAMMSEVLRRRFTRLAKEMGQGADVPEELAGLDGLAATAEEIASLDAGVAPGAAKTGAQSDPDRKGGLAARAEGLGAGVATGPAKTVAANRPPLTRRSAAPSPARGEGWPPASPQAPAQTPDPQSAPSEHVFAGSPHTSLPSPLAGEGGAPAPGEGEPQTAASGRGAPALDDGDDALTQWASEEADAAEPDPSYMPDGLFADADPGDRKSGWGVPDLVLIDGGQGQLAAAHAVLDALGIKGITLVGIAKGPDRNAGREHFFMRGRASFMLEPRDPVLYFVQRLRDEAHRFAIGTHRAKRSKAIAANPLDEIAGIGPRRRRALLQHFGSAKAISRAGVEDLQAVEGISDAMAQTIYDHFQGGKSS